MTVCNITGYQCHCQPPEVPCDGIKELREAYAAWRKQAEQFRKALEMIRDGAIPQAMSPALFAEFVLRGPLPQPAEHK